MRSLFLLLLLSAITLTSAAQYVYTIKADSVKITSNCDTAEFILENRTRHIKGFLYNKGNGRTEFRKADKLTDSSFVIGTDTISLLGSRWMYNGSNNLTPKPFAGDHIELNKPLHILGSSNTIQQFIKLPADQTQATPITQVMRNDGVILLETRAQHGTLPDGNGYTNLFIGRDAGKNSSVFTNSDAGSHNIGIGDSALHFMTGSPALNNVAIGGSALKSNTGGHNNVAIGFKTLEFTTTAFANLAIGSNSLRYFTSGTNNVAIGESAMRSVSTGDYNVAIGSDAGRGRAGGNANTLLGPGAGQRLGVNPASGNNNIFIGFNAGRATNVANYNIVIGNLAADGASGIGDHKLWLGNGGTPLIYGEMNNSLLKVNGKLGVGINATANITLKAGAAGANNAPLKFTTGNNLATPEDGAVEYDGVNYFVTSGTTRHTLAKTLTATATLNFPSTVTQTDADLTITLAGASIGDAVVLGTPNGAVSAGSAYSAWVSAANTVTIRLSVYGTSAADPASGVFRVSVLKY